MHYIENAIGMAFSGFMHPKFKPPSQANKFSQLNKPLSPEFYS